mmetsp:Transcript_27047/g.80210  ORF Transcript_27047/g.80210 Transcript_27047/m.80210 type:complete len:514 (-) Transcript_27047:319-1860(-)
MATSGLNRGGMSVAQRPAANAVAKAAYRIEPSIRPVLAVPQRAIDPARGFATTPRRQRGELASKLQVAAEEASGAPEGVVDESKVPDFPPLANIGYPNSVVFQAFGWESCHVGNWYGVIKSKIPELKAAGITHVWLPPCSSSPVAPQGYMPGQLYNLTSKYGTEEQLVDLNKALRAAGIAPMADIVINHRTACYQDEDGTWNRFGDDKDHDGHDINWDAWAITCDDPVFNGTGNPDTGEDFHGAPDLDHANPHLRECLTHWMEYLAKGVGFCGWRFDYAKGYGAEFIKEYVEGSVGPDSVNIGEFWTDLKWNDGDLDYNQDEARQRLADWIDGTGRSAGAFDFPLKGILQEAVKLTQYNRLQDPEGKPSGFLGWWPKRAVTFVENHDTGSTQAHWPFPKDKVEIGYAYILTHPGIPCIFWEHMFEWDEGLKNKIVNLMEVRKRNEIKSDAQIEILTAEHDVYVAKIDDKLIVKLGPRYDIGGLQPSEEEGWVKAAKGNEWVVWEKTTPPAAAA